MFLEPKPNIEDLVKRCKAGQRKAQELLYKQLAAKMLGVCLRYATDKMEAEDMLQNGFIRVFQKIDDYRGEGAFEAWVRRIMVHSSIEYYRRHHKMMQLVDIEGPGHEPSVNAAAASSLEAKDLLLLIKDLSPGYRMVFNMYAIDGYSHKEIAEMTGISEGASKSQLSRARAILREQLIKMEKIDQLFSSKFENFEAGPSAGTWGGIARQLNEGKRKSTLSPYLSIAASLLIMLAAGIYFMPQTKPGAKKRVQNVAAKNNMPGNAIIAPVVAIKKEVTQRPEKSIAANRVKAHTKKAGYIPDKYNKMPLAKITESEPTEQLAQASPGNKDILAAVVPDAQVPLITKTEISDELPFITKPVILVTTPEDSRAVVSVPVKKHRIHSLGDLINAVVSKVDKRKDKIIEFTNTDDDESTITGLNLGLIRIKKQE